MKRGTLLAALAAGIGAAAFPAVAAAALLWTLVVSPLTTTVNTSTTFTLTATNLDAVTELGCLEVDLPGSFVIESLGPPAASNGDPWFAKQSGNAVVVGSQSGGGRLELGESVKFAIRARGTQAGDFEWPNHAHRQQDCSSADQPGVPLSVTVLPAIVSKPTPTPSPVPSPEPTEVATNSPRPTAAATRTPVPEASLALPTPDPNSTPPPTDTAGPTDSPDPGSDQQGSVGQAPPPTGGAAGRAALTLGFARLGSETDSSGSEMGLEMVGMMDAGYVWFVPAASVALPGLLVILFVALQAAGALAWIPSMRRMEEAPDPRRKARPAA